MDDHWTWRPGPGATRAERAALGTAGGGVYAQAYAQSADSTWEVNTILRGGGAQGFSQSPVGRSYGRQSAAPASYQSGEPVRRVRRRRRTAGNRRTALVLFFIAAWLVFGYASGLVKILQVRHQITDVKKQMAVVVKENQTLQKRVDYMKSPEYVEKIARTELGLVKPDEVKFVLAKSVDGRNPESRDVARRSDPNDKILH